MNEVKAIVVENNGIYEVRCRSCGKLLFTFTKNANISVDKATQNVKIVSRCTRNSCKVDNYIWL